MTDRERSLLERIDACLGAIPNPAVGGTQSTAAAGYVAHSLDIQAVIPIARKALRGVAFLWVRDATAGIDYESPLPLIEAMENWVTRRKAADWALPVPPVGVQP